MSVQCSIALKKPQITLGITRKGVEMKRNLYAVIQFNLLPTHLVSYTILDPHLERNIPELENLQRRTTGLINVWDGGWDLLAWKS